MSKYFLTVIGPGTIGWNPPQACASFLVSTNNSRLLLDCGSGALLASKQLGLDILGVDAIALSHVVHLDHSGDIPAVLFSMNYQYQIGDPHFVPRAKPLTIFGPLGTLEFINSVFDAFPASRPKSFELRVVEFDGYCSAAEPVKDFSLSAIRADHGDAPALSYLVDNGRDRLVYSGDTAFNSRLVEHSRECGLLLIEASYREGVGRSSKHMDTVSVKRVLEMSKPKRAVVTHVFPFSGIDYVLSELREEPGFNLAAAIPGLTVEIENDQ